MNGEAEGQAKEKYKLLISLWASENQVKTAKLQMFALVSSILVSAFILVPTVRLLITLIGVFFSFIWLFSIGRTLHYQSYWRSQIDEIHTAYKGSTIFEIFDENKLKAHKPIPFGRISSKHILLGTPLGATLLWLAATLWAAICN